MFYKIICDQNSISKITIPYSLYTKNNFNFSGPYSVLAGVKLKNVSVNVDYELISDSIILSKNVVDELALPLDINYQISYANGQFNIGPIVGLLFSRKSEKLTEEKLIFYTEYAEEYNDYQGILCVFSEDKIDFENNLIDGYYLCKDENQKVWRKATLPLPKSIYRRVIVSKFTRKTLIERTENKMFNSHFINKWKLWKKVKKNKILRNHFPVTIRYRSIEDIDYMLNNYESIYLKQVDGTLGKGLMRITKNKGYYTAQAREDSNAIDIETLKELEGYLAAKLKNKKYIIQEGVKAIKYDGRFSSFRVIMQKDQTCKWKCNGIVIYLGKKGGVCSNYHTGWYALTFEEFLEKSLSLTNKDISDKKEEVLSICNILCDILDRKQRNYGDFGIDLALDDSLKIWIFESNFRQSHYSPLAINDQNMYYNIRNFPIKYGVTLSGF
jgi:hypothetical protein